MRLTSFHPLGANGAAPLVEVDFRPKQALAFLAPQRDEQQETDQRADVIRRVFDRGPCAPDRCDRRRVITRNARTRPVVTIDA